MKWPTVTAIIQLSSSLNLKSLKSISFQVAKLEASLAATKPTENPFDGPLLLRLGQSRSLDRIILFRFYILSQLFMSWNQSTHCSLVVLLIYNPSSLAFFVKNFDCWFIIPIRYPKLIAQMKNTLYKIYMACKNFNNCQYFKYSKIFF